VFRTGSGNSAGESAPGFPAGGEGRDRLPISRVPATVRSSGRSCQSFLFAFGGDYRPPATRVSGDVTRLARICGEIDDRDIHFIKAFAYIVKPGRCGPWWIDSSRRSRTSLAR